MARKTLNLDQMTKFRNLLDNRTEEMANVRRNLEKAVLESKDYWRDDRRALIDARLSVFTLKMKEFEFAASEFSAWLQARYKLGKRYIEGG
jgi:hypothetical protein